MGRTRQGFSLIELTVAMSLLLFLMGGLYLVLVAGMRYYQHGEVYQTVQQQATIGMRKMVAELENSRGESIYEADAPTDYIIFPSADAPMPAAAGVWTDDGSGRLLWQKWVCYYYNDVSDLLVRTELQQAPLPGIAPPVPGAVDYPSLAAMQAAPDTQVIARRIYAVDFLVDAALPGGRTVNIDISAMQQTASDKVTRVDVQSRVLPRNSDSI